jgi:hypothetical protein
MDGYCGENDLEKNEVIEKELEDIRKGSIFYFHLGISCSSWSILRYLSSGGTRTLNNPWGTGTRSDENHGNIPLRQAVKLIKAQTQAGNYWSLEQPASSLMLSTDVMQNIMKQDGVQNILFDQCCYGLKLPTSNASSFIRKPTRIITNLPGAEKLRVRCSGSHSHTHAIGSIKHEGKYVHRSLLAGRYPPMLCRSVAEVVGAAAEQRQSC